MSLAPLRKRTGIPVREGTRVSEAQYWLRRKTKGVRKGRTWGTSLGRERKVFSTMRPWICARVS